MPFGYDKQDDRLHKLAAKLSFDYFSDCCEKRRYRGIYPITCIYFNQDPKKIIDEWAEDLIKDLKPS